MVKKKIDRTILCLGPAHSGKSVCCYLLFKFLRKFGNDAFIMDADYYSPTFRRSEFAGPDEENFLIVTPYCSKPENLTYKNFHGLAHNIHDCIENEGIILIDGVGRHTESTECLLELASMLIILCPNKYDIKTESKFCGYELNGILLHPFEFYEKKCPKCIKIKTHFKDEKIAVFDEEKFEAELFDLKRSQIKKGKILKIPEKTLETIKRIAEFLINNWFM